jgi:hypothetical protein
MFAFGKEFRPGKLRDTLEPLLEMRALVALCSLDYQAYHLTILNEDQKIILRLLIEAYNQGTRVLLHPVKGYDKTAGQLEGLLTETLGLNASDEPVMLSALQFEGRKPKDYCSKLIINLGDISIAIC